MNKSDPARLRLPHVPGRGHSPHPLRGGPERQNRPGPGIFGRGTGPPGPGAAPQAGQRASELLLTNQRQTDAVRRAAESVGPAGQALEQGVTPDALLTDVEQAMAALGELTGRTVREDITSRIFQRFCVGK